MNNLDDKIETETIKFKKVPIEKKKDNNFNLYQIILIIAFIFCILISFLLVYKKVKIRYLFKLKEKENIIKSLREQLNNIKSKLKEGKKIAVNKEEKTGKEAFIEREYLYDKIFYTSYRMNGIKDNKGNGNGYHILLKSHTLEKGLSHFDLRPFGQKKIKLII